MFGHSFLHSKSQHIPDVIFYVDIGKIVVIIKEVYKMNVVKALVSVGALNAWLRSAFGNLE